MEEDREIIDNIYNRLPIEVTNENENQKLNMRIENARIGGIAGGGAIAGAALFFIPGIGPFIGPFIGAAVEGLALYAGNRYVNNRVNNAEKEETIKAIKNSFESCIELITKKIITEYKLKNIENYELIKGENL